MEHFYANIHLNLIMSKIFIMNLFHEKLKNMIHLKILIKRNKT